MKTLNALADSQGSINNIDCQYVITASPNGILRYHQVCADLTPIGNENAINGYLYKALLKASYFQWKW